MSIDAGTRLGIAGHTGAGKTTIASLVPRFFEPTAGRVLIDGVEVGTASYGHVRPQASDLYPGYPNTRAPGFVFAFDSTELSDGPHVVTVVVRDRTGDDTVIGEQTFDVRNF